MNRKKWDYLITGGTVFDGSGEAPRREDVAIRDGRIADRGAGLAPSDAGEVLDAGGRWVMPGLLDIHTHFDLEVELAPGLGEAVRHGTTTVVVANCSLGVAFGNQRRGDQDPIVDCFARVENVPKHVLRKVADAATWNDTADYLAHLDSLPLGPNLVPLVPHSMLRIEVMGLADSVSRDPGEEELQRMEQLLEKAMDEGYAGFSTDALPFHYLANRPNRHRKIPSQHCSYGELKRLTAILRRRGRVWQATPPKDDIVAIVRNFLLTSGRLHGRPLKTTVVAALDLATNRNVARLGLFLASFLNSRAVGGHFALQALAAPFKVWAEGPITPIFEEIPSLRELNEPDLEDRDGRRALLEDPAWQADFRRMWFRGKSGFGPARLKRLLHREDLAFSRDLADMTVDRCPVADWHGETLAAVHGRLQQYQGGRAAAARSEGERAAFDAMPAPIGDDAEFFRQLLLQYDTDLYWYMVSANRDPAVVRKLIMHPRLLPGFNDSGAHLTNMAFYDCNLRALKIAAAEGDDAVAYTVRRLTREPAELFGVDAGTLAPGGRADVTVIDPGHLAAYDAEASIRSIHRDAFDHAQLVNRSDGVVPWVLIGGRPAWRGERFDAAFERERMGRVLRVGADAGAAGAAVAQAANF